MRKLSLIVLIAAIALGGCSGVALNAEYSQLLDRTAALSAETARRARAGTLERSQMTASLVSQADTWRKFADARDGRR